MDVAVCDPDGIARVIPAFPYPTDPAIGWTPPPETYWTYDALMGKSDGGDDGDSGGDGSGSGLAYHDLICMEDASNPANWRTDAHPLFSYKGGVVYRNLNAGIRSGVFHPYDDSHTELHYYTSFPLDVIVPCDRASYWVSTPPIEKSNIHFDANFTVLIFNIITVDVYIDWTTNDGIAGQIHYQDSVGWPGAINYDHVFNRVQARNNAVRVRVMVSGRYGDSYFRLTNFTGGPDA